MAGRRMLAAVAAMTMVVLAFVAGYAAYPLLHAIPLGPAVTGQVTQQQEMGQYWQVWNLLERDFYGEKPADEERTFGAIAGMVQSFGDPYTFFVEPEPRELERDQLAGKFGGIGATLELSDTGWVLHPLPEQPAARAGLLDGDVLIAVDGAPITGTMSSDAVIALVRGEPGTTVELRVRRAAPGEAAQELEFSVTRAEIETPSMEWRLLDDSPQTADVGYIRHTLFSERSADEMRRAVEELQAAGAHRFVWDLRGNPGGLLNIAVELADMWLDDGVILTEEKADGTRKVFSATPGQAAGTAPLVVIVDGGSASASEIVAGALRDHGRAQLVGSKTYGKGSVQLIHELADRSSLHVTTAQWFTPDGTQISGQGLAPDIAVAEGDDPLPAAVASLPMVQEARR
ncbi:MAG: S41 family peptidase [Caldilinea sp.]|nr:S41 family peptidase [Caldilineaceae bacterium]MCO5209220.1 S41 family peptidase [Caldilinea sp.]MCW5841842.1 S41 family peptidase [Caldilinea sp.]